jgi:tetratricopeptide (TPR) repeat protein
LVVTAAVTEKAPILDRNALLRLAQLAQRCPNTGPVYARALCRAGDYRESLQAFRQVGQELRASDLLFQAKAHSGLGQSVEARASLVKALKWIENADQMEADGCERVWVDWSERVRVKRLLREVEGMFSEARPN